MSEAVEIPCRTPSDAVKSHVRGVGPFLQLGVTSPEGVMPAERDVAPLSPTRCRSSAAQSARKCVRSRRMRAMALGLCLTGRMGRDVGRVPRPSDLGVRAADSANRRPHARDSRMEQKQMMSERVRALEAI